MLRDDSRELAAFIGRAVLGISSLLTLLDHVAMPGERDSESVSKSTSV